MNLLKQITSFFILLICLCSFASLTAAQEQTIKPETSLSLADKIKAVQKGNQQIIESQSTIAIPTNITALLGELPVTEQNIDAKIENINETIISQETIKEVDNTIHTISEALVDAKNRRESITSINKKIESNIEELQGIKQLISNPLNQTLLPDGAKQSTTQMIQETDSLLQTNKKLDGDENQLIERLEKTIELLTQWRSSLTESLLATHDKEQKTDIISVLEKKQQHYTQQISDLQSKLNEGRHSLSLDDITQLQKSIFEAQTNAWLIEIDQQLAAIAADVIEIFSYSELNTQNNAEVIELHLETIRTANDEITNLRNQLDLKSKNIQEQTSLIGESSQFKDAIAQRQQQIGYQLLYLQKVPERLAIELSRVKQNNLFSRDSISISEGTLELDSFLNTLLLIAYQIKISFQILVDTVLQHPISILLMAIAAMFFFVVLIKGFNYLFNKKKNKLTNDYIVANGLRQLFGILWKRLFVIVMLLFITVLVEFSNIPYPSNQIIHTLIYGLLALLVFLGLVTKAQEGKILSPRTIWLAKTLGVLLVLAFVIYTIAKMSSASPSALYLYEKCVFITLLGFILTARSAFYYYNKAQTNHSMSQESILLAVRLGLWVNLCASIVGLVGYSQFAWLLIYITGMILLYSAALLSGIVAINTLRKKLKLASLRIFEHGTFIAQSIVAPLSLVIKLSWIFAISASFFRLLGWNSNSYLIAKLIAFFQYPLLTVGNNAVTLYAIVLFIVSIYTIFKVAKWLRQFSYHWLYSGVDDLGLRNSLSIFSQYLLVLTGVLITLKVIGIDLTSFAVFAGALGVGIGLGLQDVAKNFIAGLLILMERPLRKGDWVTIDNNEGTVKSIGMRAINIETFDKQDVIVPNAHVISSSFTNWTHSDSVTRTIIYVGAAYSCKPEIVINVLSQIINGTDGVLADPSPKIVMWEYADSSINYRIQYFINLEKTCLHETKTIVLKEIWHAFDENNIEIPFPQRDIHFRNVLVNGTPEEKQEADTSLVTVDSPKEKQN